MKRIAFLPVLILFLAFMLFTSHGAGAETILNNVYSDDPVTSSLDWLRNSQNEDGSWGTDNEMKQLNTLTVVHTLGTYGYLNENYSKGIIWLQANPPQNNDYLARYVSITELATPEKITELTGKQNDDGGWGLLAGYASDSLDTALAMSALLKKEGYDQEISRAAEYLLGKQNSNGSWSLTGNGTGSIYLTGLVRSVLLEYQEKSGADLSVYTGKAADWLMANRNAQGGWGAPDEAVYLTCMAFNGLAGDRWQSVQDVPAYLETLQQPNGSMNDSPYLTTLALDLLSKETIDSKVELKDVKLFANGMEAGSFDAKSNIDIRPVYTGHNVILEVTVISPGGERYPADRDNLGRFFWNTGLNQAGNYHAEVVLKDSTGQVQGTITKPFTIHLFLEISQSYLEAIPGVTQLNNPVSPLVRFYVNCEINNTDPVTVIYSVYSSVSGSVYSGNAGNSVIGSVYSSGANTLLQKEIPLVLHQGENYLDLDKFTVDCTIPTDYTIEAEIVAQGKVLTGRKAAFKVLEKNSSFYTTDEDFERGSMKNVNHDEVHDQLQLNKTMEVHPYIWIANAGEGTLSKLNTRTGKEVARYRTGPGNPDPSRTAVDEDGNCWVANRGNGTVLKIAMTGGVDRNNNGKIDTSYDINENGKIDSNEILPWGVDEAVLTVSTVGDTNSKPRALAIDKQGRIWVGLYNRYKYVVLDPDGHLTGLEVKLTSHPYGASIDTNGYLWSATYNNNRIEKIDTNNPISVKDYPVGMHTYGIVADKNGIVWSPASDTSKLVRFEPVAEKATYYKGDGSTGRGVAVDRDGNIWAAYSGTSNLNKFSPAGVFLKSVTLSPNGRGPIGVAVDGDGYVWAVNQWSNNATKLSTDGTIIGYYPVGSGPYTYSDMTGFNLSNFTDPKGVWSVVYDGGTDDHQWDRITWHSQVPGGTGLTVRARAADQPEELVNEAYVAVSSGQPIENLKGHFIQVEVEFTTTNQQSPVLEDISIGGIDGLPFADAGPDQVVPMTSKDSTKVILDGTRSYDPGGNQLTYKWTWSGGEAATPQPEVTLPEGTTEISLTVNNGKAHSTPDQVKITVVGPSSMDTRIITDREEYLPNETVQSSVYAQNSSSLPWSTGLVVHIIDENGAVLATLATEADISWNPGESKEFSYSWNCGAKLAGTYKIRATWSEGGAVIAVNTATFRINTDGALSNIVTTDKMAYAANENVNIRETVRNASNNAIFTNLTVKTEIRDPDGHAVWNKATPVQEILPGASYQIKSDWSVAQAAYGDYSVVSVVYQGDTALYQAGAQFKVLPSGETGQGVSGRLDVMTKNIYPSDNAVFQCTLNNLGNTDLSGIQRRIIIVDPTNGEVVDTIKDSINLAVNQTISDTVVWTHDILKQGNYLVVYDVTLNDGTVLPLFSGYFSVEKPYELIKQQVVRPRVLVWAESQANIDLVVKALDGMQVYYHLVNSREAFMAELLTGKYNTYVMLNKSLPLTDHDDQVLASEVAGGKGVVATGGSNGDNLKQFGLFGIKEIGSVSAKGYTVSFNSGSPLGEFVFTGSGIVQRVLLTGGQQEAAVSTEKVTLPGVVLNQYGQGQAAMFTFDLGEANPNGDAVEALRRAVAKVAPVQEAQGSVAEIEMKVQAKAAVDAMLKEVIPAGTKLLWSSPGFTSSNPPAWLFSTVPDQEYTFRYVVKLPEGVNTIDLTTDSYYLAAGEYRLFNTTKLTVTQP